MKKHLFASVLLLLLPACASIIDGHTQAIAVNTSPPKADCTLNRLGTPVGQIDSTPGSVVIEKSRDDIHIICTKDGYEGFNYINKSGTDGWVFGNIIFGGIIGLVIDAGTGAINKYDPQVNISLALTPPDEDKPHPQKKKHHDDEDDNK